jgi:CHRD domain
MSRGGGLLKRVVALLAGLVVFGDSLGANAQTGETFKARLSPLPRDATNMADLTGVGSVSAVLVGTRLTITGTFEGLRGPATVARVHRAQPGVRGNPVLDLTVSKATSGTIGGTLTLTPMQVQDLRKGWFYVQIHSEKAPDGNLWGWLLR